jgi:hypothetical protein
MNNELRSITDRLHLEAQARYALALDDNYHTVTAGMPQSSLDALRHYALAILGSPYLRVTNRRWGEDVIAWLATLEQCRCCAAKQNDD